MELRLFCTSKLILLSLSLRQCQKFGKDPAVLGIYRPFSNIYQYSFSFGTAFSVWNIHFLLKLPSFLCFLFLAPISGATSSLPSLGVLVARPTSLVAHRKHGETIPHHLMTIQSSSMGFLELFRNFFPKQTGFVGGILVSAEGWDGTAGGECGYRIPVIPSSILLGC